MHALEVWNVLHTTVLDKPEILFFKLLPPIYVSVGVEFCLVIVIAILVSKYRSNVPCASMEYDRRANNWNPSDNKLFDANESPRINYMLLLVSVYSGTSKQRTLWE